MASELKHSVSQLKNGATLPKRKSREGQEEGFVMMVDTDAAGSATYVVTCQRNQLYDLYMASSLGDGLFFYDQEYVVRVEACPDDVSPDVMTQTLAMKLQDVPTLVGYFINGSLRGGRKRNIFAKGFSEMKKLAQPLVKEVGRDMAAVLKKHATAEVAKLVGSGAYEARGPHYAKNLKKRLKRKLRKEEHEVKGRGAYGSATFTGGGSYTVYDDDPMLNQLVNNHNPSGHVMSVEDESDGLVITGCEYIADVYNNTSANIVQTSYPDNPGLPAVFSKCSQYANFERYYDIQKVWMLKSDIVYTGGSPGEWLGLYNYNPAQSIPNSKSVMLDYHGAVCGRADQDLVIGVECQKNKIGRLDGFLVRSTGIGPNLSIQLYDPGAFVVATNSIPSAAVPNGGIVGRLYCYYKIRFFAPVLNSAIGYLNRIDQFQTASGLTQAILLNTGMTASAYNCAGSSITANNVLTLGNNLNGIYRVALTCSGTTFANTPTGFTLGGNVLNYSAEGPTLAATNINIASSTALYLEEIVEVLPASTNGGNSITVSLGSFTAATVTASSITIEQINPNRYGIAVPF